MQVAYRIETARLVLRCFRPEDAPLRKEAMDTSPAHLTSFRQPSQSEPLDAHLAHARKCRGRFDLDQDLVFAVLDSTEQRLLGEVGLLTRAGPGAREVGYWIRADETRKGLTTEAVCALVRVAFEVLGLERLDVRCGVDNIASAGVARKVGFVLEGTLRHRRNRPEDSASDDLAFSMIRSDFDASPAARVACRAFDIVGTTITF
jgi:RimJ/RimL family protein N-acetyltransferase